MGAAFLKFKNMSVLAMPLNSHLKIQTEKCVCPLQIQNLKPSHPRHHCWKVICLWGQSPHKWARAPINLPLPSHLMLSEKTALYEPEIGPHRTCQSSVLRLSASRLAKDKFLLLVSHPVCHSCNCCSNMGWREHMEGETVNTANGKQSLTQQWREQFCNS